MLLPHSHEALISTSGTERTSLPALVKESKGMVERWKQSLVVNEDGPKFWIDDDMGFHFITAEGEQRTTDITQGAFSQLCQRVGVPANYIKKCFENGKSDLALKNLRDWSADARTNMVVRESDGAARAVVGEGYKIYDSHKILKTLSNVVDTTIYEPSQSLLSPERMHIRFVNHEPLPIDNHSRPLYSGFTVDSSDVGTGSLKMNFFIFDSVCRNGMVMSKLGGTLFSMPHNGSEMANGKLELFNKALIDMDALTYDAYRIIQQSQNKMLNKYELKIFLEMARNKLKMSAKSTAKLESLVDNTYNHSLWGVISGVTELAQDFSLDTRMEYEGWAGDLFAGNYAA